MTSLEIRNNSCSFKDLAKNLLDDTKVFHLSNVLIEGTEEDMQLFFSCVRGHPSLEEFYLKNVATTTPSVSLDLVVCALFTSAPCIERVHIENTPIRASNIASIEYCSTIKTLSILNHNLSNDDTLVIAEAILSSGAPLETLHFSANSKYMKNTNGKDLEQLLENHPCKFSWKDVNGVGTMATKLQPKKEDKVSEIASAA